MNITLKGCGFLTGEFAEANPNSSSSNRRCTSSSNCANSVSGKGTSDTEVQSEEDERHDLRGDLIVHIDLDRSSITQKDMQNLLLDSGWLATDPMYRRMSWLLSLDGQENDSREREGYEVLPKEISIINRC